MKKEIEKAAQRARMNIAFKLSSSLQSLDDIKNIEEVLTFDQLAEEAFIQGVRWTYENLPPYWISVRKDLPYKHPSLKGDYSECETKRVFVYRPGRNPDTDRMIYPKFGGEWEWETFRSSVKYWMPIPEIPREYEVKYGINTEDIESIELVKNERLRQIIEKGYSFNDDDQETAHQLSDAAMVYASTGRIRREVMHCWPWNINRFKPGDNTIDGRIRELSKAGALICAEIDRLIRLKRIED